MISDDNKNKHISRDEYQGLRACSYATCGFQLSNVLYQMIWEKIQKYNLMFNALLCVLLV